jgi:hypothetical protein
MAMTCQVEIRLHNKNIDHFTNSFVLKYLTLHKKLYRLGAIAHFW